MSGACSRRSARGKILVAFVPDSPIRFVLVLVKSFVLNEYANLLPPRTYLQGTGRTPSRFRCPPVRRSECSAYFDRIDPKIASTSCCPDWRAFS